MAENRTMYDALYAQDGYYWGTEPGAFCDALIELRPFPRASAVLDIGCGEGKDAVYMARRGYRVSAFDITRSGVAKTKELARQNGVCVDAFVGDINDFQTKGVFDIVYSTGTLQYLREENKEGFFKRIRKLTRVGSVAYFNVFVEKPFLDMPPDWDYGEKLWRPGELLTWLADWKVHRVDEVIFEDDSGGKSHFHCMDTVICERML